MIDSLFKIILFTLILSFACSGFVFSSRSVSCTYVMTIETIHYTNVQLTEAFSNQLIQSLFDERFYLSDNNDSDYLFFIKIKLENQEYIVDFEIHDLADKTKQWSDSVYTADIWGTLGIKDCADAVAHRSYYKIRNRILAEYHERIDYKKYYSRIHKRTTHRYPSSIQMINLINVPMKYPVGFDFKFAFNFGLEVFQFGIIFLIPETPIGLGIGSEVINLHGPETGSILPLQLYLPLYVYPDPYDYNRKELYLCLDWGFLVPQYSYIDLSFKAMFNGITLNLGWLYRPSYQSDTYSRTESTTFYAGLIFTFGNYHANWADQ